MPVSSRLERLRNRRSDATDYQIRANAAFEKVREDDAVKYLVGAMEPIDATYTRNTVAEAQRVQAQLEGGYPSRGVDAEFDLQGSVTNDTHIRAYSDIDLLTLTRKFSYNENSGSGTTFQGWKNELAKQHGASVEIIRAKFPQVTVDVSGGKAIQLSGGSLRRKVDVITCTWWNSKEYAYTREKKDRGIMHFNYATQEEKKNLPFLHNHEIEIRDRSTGGNLRKVIRLLKTLKADANEESGYKKVDLSSYDIAAIGWNMPVQELGLAGDDEIRLAVSTNAYLTRLENGHILRATLEVPNRTRRVFCDEGATLEGLKALNRELTNLLVEIETGLRRTMRNLSTARIWK